RTGLELHDVSQPLDFTVPRRGILRRFADHARKRRLPAARSAALHAYTPLVLVVAVAPSPTARSLRRRRFRLGGQPLTQSGQFLRLSFHLEWSCKLKAACDQIGGA